MLDYVNRPATISIVRPGTDRSGIGVPLGHISKQDFKVSINAGIAITDDEREEIAAVAAGYKAAAASLLQVTALKFPETMAQVMSYYEARASEIEKHLIRSAIQGAVRRLRRSPAPPERRVPAPPRLPGRDLLAGMIYDALQEDGRFEVTGNPRAGESTHLVGTWDLAEVAAALLSMLDSEPR